MRKLTLGLIASELPPASGGMQEHASRLIACLAADARVMVFSNKPGTDRYLPGDVVHDGRLRWRHGPDSRLLNQAGVDAWIILNAGLAPYALVLQQPCFVYAHGSDFAQPWFPVPPPGLRLAWRLLPGRDQRRVEWRRRQVRTGLQAARLIFANSHFTARLCQAQCGIDASRIAVVPPGIGQDFFSIPRQDAGPGLRIVTISRLDSAARRKNIDGVLHALALLRPGLPLHYTIVGDGDDRARLQHLAASLGLDDCVTFAGRLSADALRNVLAASSLHILAVIPDDTDVEGFGMVYAEAAAAGVPSLGAASGGVAEALIDGVTGHLLPDARPPTIAAGIAQFAAAPDRFATGTVRDAARGMAAGVSTARMLALIRSALA